MKTKLSHVLRTYSSRPLVRLFAGFALLFAIGLFAQGFIPETGNTPIEPEIEMTRQSAWASSLEWDEFLREHVASDITSLRLIDEIDRPMAEFPNLTLLEHLTTLKLDSDNFTREELEEVKSLENLQALALEAPSIPAGTWTALGSKLRQLEVPLRLLLAHPDEVSQLVELRMLRVNRTGLTPEALSVIAKIPNLETLVLSYGLVDTFNDQSDSAPAIPPMQLSPDTLRPLAGHPSLEAIFAKWPAGTSRTTPVLPGVTLYPSGFPSIWQSALVLSIFYMAAMTAIVALQVWAQFIVQTAVVVPGYARPHQLAGLMISFGATLVGAAGLWWAGIAVVPGLVITLAFPMAFAIPAASKSTSQTVRNVLMPLVILSTLFLWFPAIMVGILPPMIAGEYTWFLHGELVLISALVFVVEIALLANAFVKLPAMTRRVYETSSLPPGLSPWDPQQQKRSTYGSKHRWMNLWDRGANFDQLRGNSLWQKVGLWRAGNVMRSRRIILYSAMFIVWFFILQLVFQGFAVLTDLSMWHFCMLQLGAMILIFPPIAWHQRSRSLQIESLRPVRRKDMVRQLFTALALDQSLAILPLAIGFGLLIAFPRQAGRPAEPYIILALGLAGLAWVYALSTTVFAIKTRWILAGVFIAMFVLPVAWTGLLAFIVEMPEKQQIVPFAINALVIGVLAVGILGASYWKSLRREWG